MFPIRISLQSHHWLLLSITVLCFAKISSFQCADCFHTRRHTAIPMVSIDQIPEVIQQVEGIFTNPESQSQLLNDLAEASTDVVILSTEPETIILRLAAVCERVLALSADYIPDKMIRPEEWLLNIPVVGVSLFYFGKSAFPIVKARFVELDDLDLTAYKLCFAPVGVKLWQFKCMKATGCFDWIECSPGRVLIDENEDYRQSPSGHILRRESKTDDDWKYLYWQYNGTVIQSYKNNVFGIIERDEGMHINNQYAQGLLGDTRFIANIEAECRATQFEERKHIKNDIDYGSSGMDHLYHPIATMTIGSNSAKILRIDSYKLFDLMDHDERLESSIRFLLLKSLKLKIGNLLRAYNRDSNSSGLESKEARRVTKEWDEQKDEKMGMPPPL